MPGARKQGLVVLVWVTVGAVMLMLLVHLLAVSLLRSQFEAFLHPQEGQGTYLGDVHLNLFSGLLAVQGVEVRDGERILLQAAEVSVDIDPLALLQKRVHIEHLLVAGGQLRVDRAADGSLHALVPIAANDNSEQASMDIGLISEWIKVSRFNIHYVDALAQGPEVLRIENLEVRGPVQLEQQVLDFAAQAKWRDSQVQTEGSARIAQTPEASASVKLERLPLHRALAAARIDPVVQMLIDAQTEIQLSGQQLDAVGDLRLQGLQWQQDAKQLQLARVSGQGVEAHLSLSDEQALQLKIAGLAADAFLWDDAAQRVEAGRLALEKLALRMSLADAGALRVQGADLDVSGLHYLGGENDIQIVDTAAKGQWQLDLGASTFDLGGLALSLGGLQASLGDRAIGIENAGVELNAKQAPFAEPKVSGAVQLSGLQARTPQLPDDVLEVAALNLSDWQVEGSRVQLGQLRVKQLGLQKFPLSLAQAELGEVRIDGNAIALGPMVLTDLRGELRRDAKGAWQLPVAEEQTGGAASEQAESGAETAFSLAGVKVQGDSRIRLLDQSVKPQIDRDIRIKRFELGALDSRKAHKDTPFNINLVPDQYTALEIDGNLRPFSDDLYLKLKGQLSGMELALLNGLIRDDLGHRFLTGHLDDGFDLHIEKRHLKMSNELALQDLDVEVIEGKDGPPLSTAIALLEDKQGRIEMGVPVEGDLDNPDFKVLGALNPIIAKAVAGAAALAIQPLGSVVLLGGLLASEAMQVRFDPALFEPKTASIKDATKLKQLAGKLKEKPKLRLRLCGIAVPEDRTKNKKGEFVETEEQLLALAEQRAASARQVMLAEGVTDKQLRSCRPVLEDKPEAKARVDIRL